MFEKDLQWRRLIFLSSHAREEDKVLFLSVCIISQLKGFHFSHTNTLAKCSFLARLIKTPAELLRNLRELQAILLWGEVFLFMSCMP